MNDAPLGRPRFPWRWSIVAALVVLTLALGSLGFHQYHLAEGVEKSWADNFYLALQLFTLSSGNVEGDVNWSLQTARFLGPIAAAYAVVLTVLGIFSDELRRMFIGWRAGHVVVCGLGRKGERLVEQLRREGWPVIVIEPDEHNANLHRCRENGCVVIVGRADDLWNLQRAYVNSAKVMIAAAGQDGVNIEAAVRAHDLVQSVRRDALRCIVHVADPDLQSLFQRHRIFTDAHDPFELEFFNTYEVGARLMLAQSGLFDPLAIGAGRSPHLLVVGFGHLGESILRRALKDWQVDATTASPPLQVTVLDLEASQHERAFRQRHSQLWHGCDITFTDLDVRSLHEDDRASAAAILQGVTAVIIAVDDDAKATCAALTLRAMLPSDVMVVVRTSEQAGFATLFGGDLPSGAIRGISAIGLTEIGCTLEIVLDGAREVIAQAIHQGYVHDQLAAGHSTADNPALAPWHRLSEDLRRSNREQADDIRHKLHSIGCQVIANPRMTGATFRFTADETDALAQREHERWMQERLAAGWSWGERKDLQRKKNPSLVPWRDLPDEMRHYNREAVRRIPHVLAKADLEITRGQEPKPRTELIRPMRRRPAAEGVG
jgi:voltage-gated potassium channel Kch